MSLAHNISNSAALEEARKSAFAEVRELGRDSASGKDALPKLAIRVVELTYDGTFSEDDAKQVYDDYITAESKKLIHTSGGKAANVSKLRSLFKLGAMTTIDPVQVINDAARLNAEMRAQDAPVKSAYAAFVDVARAQIASPATELSDVELREVMTKATKEKSAESYLRSAAKALEEAMAQGLGEDELGHAKDALANVGAALSKLIDRSEREEKLAKIAELQASLALAA